MNSWKLIGLAGVLSMAATAAAQVTVYRDNVFEWVWTDHGTVGDGSEQLVAGVLSIVNNTGRANSNPQAFDSKASGFSGITGLLHQHDAPALSVTTEDDTSPVFATSIDTHFLLAGVPFASATGIGAPEEDTAVAVSIEPSDAPNPFDAIARTSFGSFLTMTGTRTGTVGNTWDLAYIVAPRGSTTGVHGQVAATDGSKDNVAQFSFVTPPTLPVALFSDLFDIGQDVEGDLEYTIVTDPATGAIDIVAEPQNPANGLLRMLDQIGTPATVTKQVDLPEQFHLEFDYRFNTDGKVVVTVSNIAIDTIRASDFGAGHDAFTTFSRTYVLADYGLTAGPNSLSLTLSNEGDPELFVDNFTVTGHNPIPVPSAMPALLLLLGVGCARCPSMRMRKAGVVHSSRA